MSFNFKLKSEAWTHIQKSGVKKCNFLNIKKKSHACLVACSSLSETLSKLLFVHFGCLPAVIFSEYFMPFVLRCRVESISGLLSTQLWRNRPSRFSALIFMLEWQTILVIHLHTQSRRKKKQKTKKTDKPWLKARLLRLTEHETDRIPLGVTIWKQTCTHLSIPELYHPSFLYVLLSISLSSR